MGKFTDSIRIHVRAGKGGQGAVSFHREKYIPKGGPDGGDGGKGGDVYLEADNSCYNLSHLFKDRIYTAEGGKQGMGRDRHGRDGRDLVVKVPPGTEIFDDGTGVMLADLAQGGVKVMAAMGGIGGRGNAFFKSSTHQAPRFAQPGMPGEERVLTLNLKLIADVGLVGLPNSGKSTLLSKVTNARPKIAAYPFTTLIPNLGVVQRRDGTSYRIADIPGIVEGAHRGLGLGLSFLQHIVRVRVILYLIDIAGEDPRYSLELLKSELGTYSGELLKKPSCILLTKADLADEKEIQKVIDQIDDRPILPVSSLSGYNLKSLARLLDGLLE